MHYLPPAGTEAREAFDLQDLVAIGTGAKQALTLRQAKAAAKAEFIRCRPMGVVGLIYIALAGNDDLLLVQIGPRGGVKVLWNFTRGTTTHNPEEPVYRAA